MERTSNWRRRLAIFASALLVIVASIGGGYISGGLRNNNSDNVVTLPFPYQSDQPFIAVDTTPDTHVSEGEAHFDANGPRIEVYFITRVGSSLNYGRVVARLMPNANGKSVPEINVFGDTSNIVVQRWSNDGLPVLDISYVHSMSPDDFGFTVEFDAQYRSDLGGLYIYPRFASNDWSSLSGCEIAGHTRSVLGTGGSGLRWEGYNALTWQSSADAWYDRTGPWVSAIPGGLTVLTDLGFKQGQPFADLRYQNGGITAGFDHQRPTIGGAPQKSSASC